MKFKKIIPVIFCIFLLSILVYSIQIDRKVPVPYTVYTTTSVLFNLTYNNTDLVLNYTTLNITLYTRFNSTATYLANPNITERTLVNGTYNATSIIFDDGARVWWFVSFKNNASVLVENTSVRIFDIDLDYNILSIGVNQKINLSLDDGDIFTAGGIYAAKFVNTSHLVVGNITLVNQTGEWLCDEDHNGLMIYNASNHRAIICNSTEWNALW